MTNPLVLVPLKRVLDPYAKVRLKSDGSAVDVSQGKQVTNPFDEIALEEALRLQESNAIETVVVVSIGEKAVQENLLQGLAMGADKAIHIETDNTLQPLAIAKILQILVKELNPCAVLMGKQAIDDDCNQTGQLLAALLGWAQGTFVSKVEWQNTHVQVTREVDGGLETVRCCLPAVLTTDLRLNEPRYVSLPNIMKAKSKPLEVRALSDMPVDVNSSLTLESVAVPEQTRSVTFIESVDDLADKIRGAL